MKNQTKTLLAALAALCTFTSPADAGVIIPNAKIASGTIQGTMHVVDSPSDATLSQAGPLGPTWSNASEEGYRVLSGSAIDGGYQGNSPWEVDGSSPTSQQIRVHSGGGSTYTFALADGLIIKAIYGTWTTRTVSGGTYSYTEGAASASTVRTHTTSVDTQGTDLQINWTASDASIKTANFDLLFSGDITVEGGNGFTLKVVRTGNTHQSDAIILDVVPEPSSLALLGLGGLLIGVRRRRD